LPGEGAGAVAAAVAAAERWWRMLAVVAQSWLSKAERQKRAVAGAAAGGVPPLGKSEKVGQRKKERLAPGRP